MSQVIGCSTHPSGAWDGHRNCAAAAPTGGDVHAALQRSGERCMGGHRGLKAWPSRAAARRCRGSLLGTDPHPPPPCTECPGQSLSGASSEGVWHVHGIRSTLQGTVLGPGWRGTVTRRHGPSCLRVPAGGPCTHGRWHTAAPPASHVVADDPGHVQFAVRPAPGRQQPPQTRHGAAHDVRWPGVSSGRGRDMRLGRRRGRVSAPSGRERALAGLAPPGREFVSPNCAPLRRSLSPGAKSSWTCGPTSCSTWTGSRHVFGLSGLGDGCAAGDVRVGPGRGRGGGEAGGLLPRRCGLAQDWPCGAAGHRACACRSRATGRMRVPLACDWARARAARVRNRHALPLVALLCAARARSWKPLSWRSSSSSSAA